MRVYVEPPLDGWSLAAGDPVADDALPAAIADRAGRLGLPELATGRPIVATGHQAWLWHPGILAKYLALTAAAGRFGAQALHVVVDQDVNDPLTLEVPVREGDRLRVEALTLAPHAVLTPTGAQPECDPSVVRQTLQQAQARFGAKLACDVSRLLEAWTGLPRCRTLAEQIGVVLSRLMQPLTGPLPLVLATELAGGRAFAELVERMLDDPRGCAACYNDAVAGAPAAGLMPLQVGPNRAELPLWLLRWAKPRQRVFADLGVRPHRLLGEDRQAIDLQPAAAPPGPGWAALAPRALALTALWRSRLCGLFIHGKGGGVYDRATEAWWLAWTGAALAPMAVVSADVFLDFDVPVAEPAALARAVWWRHHLPHNVDRVLQLDGPEPARKQRLLADMSRDRDRARRAGAFAELQRINASLCATHAPVVARAGLEADRARTGVANRAIVHKRDWCFALYADARLRELRAALDPGAAPAAGTL